ncbi:hypothetical protein FN846DRAFT_200922 [Sphaerosporella brunnea]|uniref:Uncharacterized protein n=1 Tax=Sphaerosporella brunnea TaxID=1250544 RepID=A0A5J5EPM3_9PEZI|nr:hypothetical protein FN846DRAFT_200922 [Sphaerosporella brunnea]
MHCMHASSLGPANQLVAWTIMCILLGGGWLDRVVHGALVGIKRPALDNFSTPVCLLACLETASRISFRNRLHHLTNTFLILPAVSKHHLTTYQHHYSLPPDLRTRCATSTTPTTRPAAAPSPTSVSSAATKTTPSASAWSTPSSPISSPRREFADAATASTRHPRSRSPSGSCTVFLPHPVPIVGSNGFCVYRADGGYRKKDQTQVETIEVQVQQAEVA